MDDSAEWRARAAEDWLKRASSLRRRAESARQTMDEIAAAIDGIGAVVYDKVGGSAEMEHGDDALSERLCRLEAARARYAARMDDFARQAERVDVLLDMLPDSRHAVLLRLHYVDGMTWEEVCADMHYSYSMMMCLRISALLSLYDIMPESVGGMPD